jgi:aminoglycoside phosphotransferase (APT) family kinase protein
VLTERDVLSILATDRPVARMFLNDEFDVWAVGDELVAKFPRTDIDAAKVVVEEALHPTLRRLLGDAVPPIRTVGAMDSSGRRFVMHERASGDQGQTIEGITITPADGLAEHVGAILSALHRMGGSQASELGAGERRVSFVVPDLSDATVAAVTQIAGEGIGRFLSGPGPQPSDRRTLCHTDIKGEHVFVDEDRRRVTSIIDWADTEVCDPAKDYAGLVGWLGPAFAIASVAASGEDDPTLVERAIWLGRAGLLDYWDAVLAGRESAPIPLLSAQLRAAFSD